MANKVTILELIIQGIWHPSNKSFTKIGRKPFLIWVDIPHRNRKSTIHKTIKNVFAPEDMNHQNNPLKNRKRINKLYQIRMYGLNQEMIA